MKIYQTCKGSKFPKKTIIWHTLRTSKYLFILIPSIITLSFQQFTNWNKDFGQEYQTNL